MSRKVNWGIIGLGKIAGKFCEDLALLEDGNLYAVASRTQENADAFSSKFGAQKAYGDYQSLMEDPEVEVVYIATPHTYHAELTLQCLDHGKAVLCEKPFAMNASEVSQMINKATDQKLFLMEAMWTRFFPATEQVLQLIRSGEIGEVRQLQADFGFVADYEPDKRLFNKSLGGGALLDIGIYPLYLSLLCLGMPKKIQASAHIGPTGVDHSLGMVLDYGQDQISLLNATLTAFTQTEAWIHGSKKSIHMHQRFHHCDRISLYNGHNLEHTFELPYEGIGYQFEIQEVMSCLQRGELQSSKMSHQDSLNLIQLLDQVRGAIDLSYE